MATGPKGTWGGRRPNQTGRPRVVDITSKERAAFIKAAKSAAKKYGRTIHEELARLCFEGLDDRTQLAAIKLYIEATKINESKAEVTTTNRVEAPIILPDVRPDPAFEVVALPAKKLK